MTNAFLDSTVILSRRFGFLDEKAGIEKAINKRTKLSTEYVKVEINRTFLTDAIFLHSLLIEEGDLHVVNQRLRGYRIKPRQKDRCQAILEIVSDKKQLRVADAIARLENLIIGMKEDLLKDIKVLASGTNCPLAREELKFIYPNFEIETSCTRESAICSLPDYLQKNIKELEALHKGICTKPELQKLYEKLGEVLQKPEKAKGINCKVLGDTIICLDAPLHCEVFSTNIKDFAPICNFLGKTFVKIK